ncbi:2-(3-amino-3-carboxypropyl)histidine synthase subunit [Candidatus Woesearchaeota archaeon]|nr:2-(3-amino-3-carboxypropyl)histidine synthase subunit [Candidatus Woesearchaeota archaeon]MBW3005250.1 2-(3-amino-3-carboxypropyl)histidine synthase subunit [Candidatus Woesearchaeota archaeon]
MKILHIHAKSKADIKLNEAALNALPAKLGVVTTIQHLHKIDEVISQLKDAVKGGQVLGCNVDTAKQISDKVDAFLFIGSGEFHPIAVALETEKKVFKWNPLTQKLTVVKEEDVEKYKKRKKAALARFLSSNKIGILVSVKHGQNRIEEALKLAAKKDKEYYLFAFDTLNPSDLENFPFIECWVNTACPRIADEKADIINISELP